MEEDRAELPSLKYSIALTEDAVENTIPWEGKLHRRTHETSSWDYYNYL